MAEIIFHSMPDSAYLWTAMHVADEKGVSYEHRPLALGSPEHLKLHPFAKMPVLQHGDAILYETAAIALYIDKAFDGPALQPADALGQAHVMRWISIVNSYIFPIMNRFMKERLVRPNWGLQADEAFIASAREPLIRQMGLIEEALRGSAHLVDARITLADSFLLPNLLFFALSPEGKALLAKAPCTAAWLARMQGRASFEKSPMAVAYRAFQHLAPPRQLVWAVD